MKRSEISRAIQTAAEFFAMMNFRLPEYASWPPEKWRCLGPEIDEIRDCMLGWDVTDFGSGDFERVGRTLFTLRNGRHGDPRYPKVYAEKAIFNPEGQRAPLHFHVSKMEDIINRAGGNILITVWMAGPDNRPSDEPFSLAISGIRRNARPGETLRMSPARASASRREHFTSSGARKGRDPRFPGRFPASAMTEPTTTSSKSGSASRRSRRMNPRASCSSASTRVSSPRSANPRSASREHHRVRGNPGRHADRALPASES